MFNEADGIQDFDKNIKVDKASILCYTTIAKLIKYCKIGIIFPFGESILFFVARKFEFDKMRIPAFA